MRFEKGQILGLSTSITQLAVGDVMDLYGHTGVVVQNGRGLVSILAKDFTTKNIISMTGHGTNPAEIIIDESKVITPTDRDYEQVNRVYEKS